jgi:hypothetical protein
MKIRELKWKSGKATLSSWPPDWGGSYERGDTFAQGEQGTLTKVDRRGDDLMLTITFAGRAHSGPLLWTPPPTTADLEKVLRAHIGDEIKTISEVDI